MCDGGRVRECTTFEELVSSLDFVFDGRRHKYDPFSVSVNNTIPIELSEMKGRHDDFVPADVDPVMGSMKNSIQGSKNSGPSLSFHIKKGHCGYHPDCQVCTYLRLHFNRIFKEIGKYVDPRPCFEFNMNIMTVSHRSSRGNKYAVLMKCPAVGFNEVLFLNHKSDFLEEWIKLVDMRRKDPRFKYATYVYMMSVHTDLDSVWDNKNKAAVAAREKLGISYVFASPENSNKNANSNVR
jgi:hypothetical protein